MKIDQVVIGSCTNGRIGDLRCTAEVLKGRHAASGMRCITSFPPHRLFIFQAMEEGLLKIFIRSGRGCEHTTCGPCLGGYMGILAAGEDAYPPPTVISVGRMGHVDSEVYLAKPAVAAASAVTGRFPAPASCKVSKGD